MQPSKTKTYPTNLAIFNINIFSPGQLKGKGKKAILSLSLQTPRLINFLYFQKFVFIFGFTFWLYFWFKRRQTRRCDNGNDTGPPMIFSFGMNMINPRLELPKKLSLHKKAKELLRSPKRGLGIGIFSASLGFRKCNCSCFGFLVCVLD